MRATIEHLGRLRSRSNSRIARVALIPSMMGMDMSVTRSMGRILDAGPSRCGRNVVTYPSRSRQICEHLLDMPVVPPDRLRLLRTVDRSFA